MNILITADWHIGKKLHNEDLSEDLQLFFDWLLKKIQEENIHYLLVAGDIFDNNNPSNEAQRLYYSFLIKLNALQCKAIIIAGNHDSPSFIDVPKELLNSLNVSVFGLFPGIDHVQKIFVPLKNEEGQEVAVVAAIPFLQDRFVRQIGEGEGALDISEKIKQGMKRLFAQIGSALQEKYPNIPKIGIAHLYAQGAQISDAERDIQIGNQDGVAADDLAQFDYLGLGHIHTGQTVLKDKIQYTSSPISLGFSENRYNHKVVKLQIIDNRINETHIPIPKNRSLYQLQGTMKEIEEGIRLLRNKYTLPALLDIKVEEDVYDPRIAEKIEALKTSLSEANTMKIINTRVIFKDRATQRFSQQVDPQMVNALNPLKVVEDLIVDRNDEEEKKKIIELFSTIYADTIQSTL